MDLRFLLAISFTICFLAPSVVNAQKKKVFLGTVYDRRSEDPLQFAAVYLKRHNIGSITDSLGNFSFVVDRFFKEDTLIISSVGHQPKYFIIRDDKDTASINVGLEVEVEKEGPVVKVKYNRSLWFWRKIMAHKDNNNQVGKWNNTTYEIHNKLELDINNIKEKFKQQKLLKPFNFIFQYVDSTSESKPFLPLFITETISDYYVQKDPKKVVEVIKAANTNGIDNESIVKLLGGIYQNLNVYAEFIPVLNKQFISPFNAKADKYYTFKLADTQYLNRKRLVHLLIRPNRKGEDLFEGDCWVHDTSFAIQKITLRPASDANINFISNLSIVQEYKLIYDSLWFLYKDKFVADIAPFGSGTASLKGRKTTTYKNILLNQPFTMQLIAQQPKSETIILATDAKTKDKKFWETNRHEALNKNERGVYMMIDSIKKNPAYIRYKNTFTFLFGGMKEIGNISIGPWYYWVSSNSYEGLRLRFDLSTNRGFNEKLFFHGYLAYGFKDEKWKGSLEGKYFFSRTPWSYLWMIYKNDFNSGQFYADQLGTDNIFGSVLRKKYIPRKYENVEDFKVEYFRENNKGFGVGIATSLKKFTSLQSLPTAAYYKDYAAEPFTSFDASIRLRYAYQEKFIQGMTERYSLRSKYPIIEVKYTKGFKGIFNSAAEYSKITAMISQSLPTPPYGNLNYKLFAGNVNGSVPFQNLEILPGNEMYYYNRYAFNLMNRYEFIADKYAGFTLEHNIGSGLFKYTPITRKLKLRQFFTARGVVGTLSEANKKLNFVGDYPFKSLDNKMYLELGTGVDNILRVFRIDFIWRVAPSKTFIDNENARSFGVFGSFRLSF